MCIYAHICILVSLIQIVLNSLQLLFSLSSTLYSNGVLQFTKNKIKQNKNPEILYKMLRFSESPAWRCELYKAQQMKLLNLKQVFSLCVHSLSHPTMAKWQQTTVRLSDFLDAYRNHHPEVQTGAHLSVWEAPAVIASSLLHFNPLFVRLSYTSKYSCDVPDYKD